MKLRVLLLADPFIRVPPARYGGIERVVADLTNGLTERGHEITDFSGRGYRDVRVGLKVRGEPEAEPKKKPGKKRHK